LLDRVALIDFDLFDLPEEHQRRLFDAFHLERRYNRHLHQLTRERHGGGHGGRPSVCWLLPVRGGAAERTECDGGSAFFRSLFATASVVTGESSI
jgi:hypothetical protein